MSTKVSNLLLPVFSFFFMNIVVLQPESAMFSTFTPGLQYSFNTCPHPVSGTCFLE